MTRSYYDGVFYRVCCVTLLAIAFTFTVILTNVFVDIDELLVNKEGKQEGKKHEHERPFAQEDVEKTEPSTLNLPTNVPEIKRGFDVEEKQETSNDVKTFEEEEDASYRTKRSLDSTNSQFHIKDPKIKNILTAKLETLLEELDNEETYTNQLDNTTPKDITITLDALKDANHLEHTTVVNYKSNDKIENDKKEKQLLHLTMHNILLQGIIGHMDLTDVYKKVHNLVQNMDNEEKKSPEKDKELQTETRKSEEQTKDTADTESMFVEELMKCAKLQKQVMEKHSRKSAEKGLAASKVPQLLIKTFVDITSLRNDKNKENDTNPKEIRGVIKFLYNGKAIKFKQTDEKDDQEEYYNKGANKFLEAIEVSDFIKDNIHIPYSIINNAIADYFSKNTKVANLFKDASIKRTKRSVKVRKAQVHHTTEKNKLKNIKNNKNNDEELYVEIETHFDGKGVQGEKKRKLVRNIINKIQKAIHSDINNIQENKNPKKYHLKKRFQAPLDNQKRILIDKFLIPFDTVVRRELTPISKSYPAEADAPNVYDRSGETWKSMLFGPHFLSATKAINSAELGEVDVRYEKESAGSMISSRMQKPLNAEPVDDDTNIFYELGNLKFYIKDLEGSGFSIGFNQFVGEAPDDESINSFTGVDNLLKSYRTRYDRGEAKPVILERNVKFIEKDDLVSEERDRDCVSENASVKEHNIRRRNVDAGNQDRHSNEYKIIFSNNFLPYDSYTEVIEDSKKKVSFSIEREKSNTTLKKTTSGIPFLIGKTIFDKELKPSEIFSLANLIDRKKRSLKVKKYSKINIGNKLNKYLHPGNKIVSKIFLKNRPRGSRNKRQVDTIRIVATDNLRHVPLSGHSDENIFLVSDENIFPEHAAVRESPEEVIEGFERPYEEYALPAFAYEEDKPHAYANAFNGKARHNILMSKYPHIFMEEISRLKEEERDAPENVFAKYNEPKNDYEPSIPEDHQTYKRIIYPSTENPDGVNNVQDIVDAISPRTNYKLTVKILPKNSTAGVNEGFKEVHTSINKSISKNGVIISSQVNVSEVSKVEKVNNSITSAIEPTTVPPIVKHIKNQQDKMNTMLKQHKQRIEEQLESLNKERQTIDMFIGDKTKELISVWLPTNPPQMLHLTKDEAGQLITSALLKLRDTPHLNELNPQAVAHYQHVSPTPIGTYAPPPSPLPPPSPPPPLPTQPRQDLEKLRLVNTILHNENLTNTILTKIDKNTQILQAFLQKLTDKFDTDRSLKKTENIYKHKADNLYSKDFRDRFLHNHVIRQSMHNTELNKNVTQVSIPFVYAYQQSFPQGNKPNIPVASVVYQGHIHANTITNNVQPNSPKSHVKLQFSNDSRFFIDDLESEFKATPTKREGDLSKLTKYAGKNDINSLSLRVPLSNFTSA